MSGVSGKVLVMAASTIITSPWQQEGDREQFGAPTPLPGIANRTWREEPARLSYPKSLSDTQMPRPDGTSKDLPGRLGREPAGLITLRSQVEATTDSSSSALGGV